jgi:hypothetical protein
MSMRTPTGEWKRLHNKELYGLITSRKMGAGGRYGGHERCIQDYGEVT